MVEVGFETYFASKVMARSCLGNEGFRLGSPENENVIILVVTGITYAYLHTMALKTLTSINLNAEDLLEQSIEVFVHPFAQLRYTKSAPPPQLLVSSCLYVSKKLEFLALIGS